MANWWPTPRTEAATGILIFGCSRSVAAKRCDSLTTRPMIPSRLSLRMVERSLSILSATVGGSMLFPRWVVSSEGLPIRGADLDSHPTEIGSPITPQSTTSRRSPARYLLWLPQEDRPGICSQSFWPRASRSGRLMAITCCSTAFENTLTRHRILGTGGWRRPRVVPRTPS